MNRTFQAAVAVLIFAVGFATPSLADSCTSFNQFQHFSPDELERCLWGLRLDQQTMETEIQTSEKLTCLLGQIIANAKPEPDPRLDDFLKKFCPAPKQPPVRVGPSKTPQAPPSVASPSITPLKKREGISASTP
jgi:hypothetical protein